jgi:hypothetical protein
LIFSLPTLQLSVEELLRNCQAELDDIPAPSTADPSTEIMIRVTTFCDDFRAATFGDSRKTLVQENRQRYMQFKQAILQTRPDFRPFHDYMKYSRPHFTNDEPKVQCVGPPLDLTAVEKVIAELVALLLAA